MSKQHRNSLTPRINNLDIQPPEVLHVAATYVGAAGVNSHRLSQAQERGLTPIFPVGGEAGSNNAGPGNEEEAERPTELAGGPLPKLNPFALNKKITTLKKENKELERRLLEAKSLLDEQASALKAVNYTLLDQQSAKKDDISVYMAHNAANERHLARLERRLEYNDELVGKLFRRMWAYMLQVRPDYQSLVVNYYKVNLEKELTLHEKTELTYREFHDRMDYLEEQRHILLEYMMELDFLWGKVPDNFVKEPRELMRRMNKYMHDLREEIKMKDDQRKLLVEDMMILNAYAEELAIKVERSRTCLEDNDALTDALSKETEEVERLTEENAEGKAEIERLTEETAEGKAEIERLTQEKSEGKAEIEKLTKENTEVKAEMGRLTEENAALKTLAENQKEITTRNTHLYANTLPREVYQNKGGVSVETVLDLAENVLQDTGLDEQEIAEFEQTLQFERQASEGRGEDDGQEDIAGKLKRFAEVMLENPISPDEEKAGKELKQFAESLFEDGGVNLETIATKLATFAENILRQGRIDVRKIADRLKAFVLILYKEGNFKEKMVGDLIKQFVNIIYMCHMKAGVEKKKVLSLLKRLNAIQQEMAVKESTATKEETLVKQDAPVTQEPAANEEDAAVNQDTPRRPTTPVNPQTAVKQETPAKPQISNVQEIAIKQVTPTRSTPAMSETSEKPDTSEKPEIPTVQEEVALKPEMQIKPEVAVKSEPSNIPETPAKQETVMKRGTAVKSIPRATKDKQAASKMEPFVESPWQPIIVNSGKSVNFKQVGENMLFEVKQFAGKTGSDIAESYNKRMARRPKNIQPLVIDTRRKSQKAADDDKAKLAVEETGEERDAVKLNGLRQEQTQQKASEHREIQYKRPTKYVKVVLPNVEYDDDYDKDKMWADDEIPKILADVPKQMPPRRAQMGIRSAKKLKYKLDTVDELEETYSPPKFGVVGKRMRSPKQQPGVKIDRLQRIRQNLAIFSGNVPGLLNKLDEQVRVEKATQCFPEEFGWSCFDAHDYTEVTARKRFSSSEESKQKTQKLLMIMNILPVEVADNKNNTMREELICVDKDALLKFLKNCSRNFNIPTGIKDFAKQVFIASLDSRHPFEKIQREYAKGAEDRDSQLLKNDGNKQRKAASAKKERLKSIKQPMRPASSLPGQRHSSDANGDVFTKQSLPIPSPQSTLNTNISLNLADFSLVKSFADFTDFRNCIRVITTKEDAKSAGRISDVLLIIKVSDRADKSTSREEAVAVDIHALSKYILTSRLDEILPQPIKRFIRDIFVSLLENMPPESVPENLEESYVRIPDTVFQMINSFIHHPGFLKSIHILRAGDFEFIQEVATTAGSTRRRLSSSARSKSAETELPEIKGVASIYTSRKKSTKGERKLKLVKSTTELPDISEEGAARKRIPRRSQAQTPYIGPPKTGTRVVEAYDIDEMTQRLIRKPEPPFRATPTKPWQLPSARWTQRSGSLPIYPGYMD